MDPLLAATFASIVATVQVLLNEVIRVLFLIASIVFMAGIIMYVIAGGEKKVETARNVILYGFIGLAVMVGMWGLVGLVQRTIFGSSAQPGINLDYDFLDSGTQPAETPQDSRFLSPCVNGRREWRDEFDSKFSEPC